MNDRLITVTDGENVTSYSYDALGRVVETSRPNGTNSAYTYNVSGNLTELVNTDADGAVISSFTYTYDLRGYIVEEVAKTADTTVTRKYQYNLSGELVEFTEREGLKLATYAYTYDDSGNRIRLAKSGIDQPETITYTYNEKNQLISENSTIDGTTNYAYNENGSLTSERTEGREEVTYEYTVEQRLAAIREGGALLMAASYDGDGNRVFQISRTQAIHYVQKEDVSDAAQTPSSPVSGSAGTTGSVQGSTSGDSIQIGASDLTPIPGVSGNETGSDTAEDQKSDVYTYYERVYVDPADSIFWYGFGQGMLQTFGNLNTALSACLSDWFSHAWDYVTGQYELVIHSKEQATTYSETDVEALRSVGLSEADIAAITGETQTAAAESEETTAADSGTTRSTGSEKDTNTIVIPEKPSEKERVDYELTYYVNDINTENTQVLMEYGKRDQLKNVYTYGIERISVETIADTVNPQTDEIETDYYLYDGRGSVANVVSAETKVLNAYSYDPFGNVMSGAPEFDSFYGYNAEETNPVTGMQYLRARYYDTETGRFQAADTYLGDVSKPLTLNRYSYTTNNPVMENDPSGHWPSWLDKAVDTVKTGAKKVANWVNDNVVKPVVNTAKSAASWVNNNVIKPVIHKANNLGNAVKEKWSTFTKGADQKFQEVAYKIEQGYQNIKNAVTKDYQQTKQYIQERTAEIKQKVIEFSCGKAGRISTAWETVKQDPLGMINDGAAFIVDTAGQFANTDLFGDAVSTVISMANPGIDVGKFWTKNNLPGAEEVIGVVLGAERDDDGVYHIKQDYWQSWAPIGYNDGYDNVFDVAISATGNSMDKNKSAEFTVDGKTYMFWAWKGDYMNLGAGAETGIYEKYSDTHWLTATDKSTNMELTLEDRNTEEVIFAYKPAERTDLVNDGKQWWITGFASQTQNVQASDLISTTVIDFSAMDDGIRMYNAFREATLVDEATRNYWTFTDDYKAILTW